MSYSDLRIGDGKVYEASGFLNQGDTKANCWYTNGRHRFDRFAYRTQDGMSEKEFALVNKVRVCWGPGNSIWKLDAPFPYN